MLISNKSNTLSVLLYCILTIILISCGTDPTSSKNDTQGTVHHDGNGMTMTFASPDDLANALIGEYSLQAEATVNGGSPYTLNVNPVTNEISGTIPDISAGTYNLKVTYFIFTTGKVVLCTFSKDVTVKANHQSDVIIGDSDLHRNYDDDNDGYTNLEEIKKNTDPLDRDSYPGNPLLVTVGNGTTESVSSANYNFRIVLGASLAGTSTGANSSVVVSYYGDTYYGVLF